MVDSIFKSQYPMKSEAVSLQVYPTLLVPCFRGRKCQPESHIIPANTVSNTMSSNSLKHEEKKDHEREPTVIKNNQNRGT